jgi:hypothetical protein
MSPEFCGFFAGEIPLSGGHIDVGRQKKFVLDAKKFIEPLRSCCPLLTRGSTACVAAAQPWLWSILLIALSLAYDVANNTGDCAVFREHTR